MLTEWNALPAAWPRDPAVMILVFFLYSHLGYLMECVVLTWEKKRLVINRGFVRHLPFCIIYGFGAMLGVPLLSELAGNLPLLFVASAVGASLLELVTARVQLYLFGDYWWDYTGKRFNYQGILCLESTIGWGFVGIFIIRFLHGRILQGISLIPAQAASLLAMLLVTAYAVDFLVSARKAWRNKQQALSATLMNSDISEYTQR